MTNDHPIRSPWSSTRLARSEDTWRELADGIWSVITPSHGGIWLSRAARAKMPPELRAVPTFTGGPWYEEDCDWALVALAFPELFEPRIVQAALGTTLTYHAKKFDIEAFLLSPAGQKCHARVRDGIAEQIIDEVLAED